MALKELFEAARAGWPLDGLWKQLIEELGPELLRDQLKAGLRRERLSVQGAIRPYLEQLEAPAPEPAAVAPVAAAPQLLVLCLTPTDEEPAPGSVPAVVDGPHLFYGALSSQSQVAMIQVSSHEEGFAGMRERFPGHTLHCEPALASWGLPAGFEPRELVSLEKIFRAAAAAWMCGNGLTLAGFDALGHGLLIGGAQRLYQADLARNSGDFHFDVEGHIADFSPEGRRPVYFQGSGRWQLAGRDDDGLLLHLSHHAWYGRELAASRRLGTPGPEDLEAVKAAMAAAKEPMRLRVDFARELRPGAEAAARDVGLPFLPLLWPQHGEEKALTDMKTLHGHTAFAVGALLLALGSVLDGQDGDRLGWRRFELPVDLGQSGSLKVTLQRIIPPCRAPSHPATEPALSRGLFDEILAAAGELDGHQLLITREGEQHLAMALAGPIVHQMVAPLEPAPGDPPRLGPADWPRLTPSQRRLWTVLAVFGGGRYRSMSLGGFLGFFFGAMQVLDLATRPRVGLAKIGLDDDPREMFVFHDLAPDQSILAFIPGRLELERLTATMAGQDGEVDAREGLWRVQFRTGDQLFDELRGPLEEMLGLTWIPELSVLEEGSRWVDGTTVNEVAELLQATARFLEAGEDEPTTVELRFGDRLQTYRFEPLPLPWARLRLGSPSGA